MHFSTWNERRTRHVYSRVANIVLTGRDVLFEILLNPGQTSGERGGRRAMFAPVVLGSGAAGWWLVVNMVGWRYRRHSGGHCWRCLEGHGPQVYDAAASVHEVDGDVVRRRLLDRRSVAGRRHRAGIDGRRSSSGDGRGRPRGLRSATGGTAVPLRPRHATAWHAAVGPQFGRPSDGRPRRRICWQNHRAL